jgi:hypothetical protein
MKESERWNRFDNCIVRKELHVILENRRKKICQQGGRGEGGSFSLHSGTPKQWIGRSNEFSLSPIRTCPYEKLLR